VHQSRKAPQEISNDGDQMSALARRLVVALTAVATGAFMVMFGVEHYRGKRRRSKEVEQLTTILGTVYPHSHQKKHD
jgi:hypothetical protein